MRSGKAYNVGIGRFTRNQNRAVRFGEAESPSGSGDILDGVGAWSERHRDSRVNLDGGEGW